MARQKSNYHNTIIVFSHLRWNSVTQRPQHLIREFAKNFNILFVEEPDLTLGLSSAKINKSEKNITVLTHGIPLEMGSRLAKLVNRVSPETKLNKVLWFYSPAFINTVPFVEYSGIVYDCMDELSAFKGAPAHLVGQERILLTNADIVFTGGKSLFESKRQFNWNTHCYPSSVDTAHFRKAIGQGRIPADIKEITPPIAGYYGVIDERLDYELISEISDQNPDLSFVYIGPVVKVNPADLPRADNIHFLGNKPYEILPDYLRYFDVAIMPFALSEATKYISPTKTLEFMAAHKPIISTPIYDVVRDYHNIVKIAENSFEFSQIISELLHEPSEIANLRVLEQVKIVSATSWENTAYKMMLQIQNTILAGNKSIPFPIRNLKELGYD